MKEKRLLWDGEICFDGKTVRWEVHAGEWGPEASLCCYGRDGDYEIPGEIRKRFIQKVEEAVLILNNNV